MTSSMWTVDLEVTIRKMMIATMGARMAMAMAMAVTTTTVARMMTRVRAEVAGAALRRVRLTQRTARTNTHAGGHLRTLPTPASWEAMLLWLPPLVGAMRSVHQHHLACDQAVGCLVPRHAWALLHAMHR